MPREVLSRSQLKRLAEHKYSVTGVSLLEPLMQRFWKWVVLLTPEWWAPNAMTLSGLIINVVTAANLMWYSPDGKGEPPMWSYLLCSIGLFVYQTLDAIDGKQARRMNCSSPLGELFDHGCDALSIVFVIVSTCIALQLGFTPKLMFFECFATMFLFYAAHWQAYCSGQLKFGWIDVTEGQLSISLLYIVSGVFGSSVWSYQVPGLGIELKMFPLFFSFFGAILACYTNFYTIFMQGGVGKNGSTVAGTSVLSPLGPIAILLSLAVIIWTKSPTDVFQQHIVLYIISFGMAACKITNKLVIAHMSRTEMELLDTSLIGPLLLFFNQYWDTWFSEYLVLWVFCIYCFLDLTYFSVQVCGQMCNFFNIYCFRIAVSNAGGVGVGVSRSTCNGENSVTGRGSSTSETSATRQRTRPNGGATTTDSSRSRSSSGSSCDAADFGRLQSLRSSGHRNLHS